MTESALVDTRVRVFADHIQCDPELEQEVYFKHKVSSTLENEQKASSVRELDVPQIVSNNLDRAAKAFESLSPFDDQLIKTLRIQWLDLKAQVEDLNITLKDNISFFNAALA